LLRGRALKRKTRRNKASYRKIVKGTERVKHVSRSRIGQIVHIK